MVEVKNAQVFGLERAVNAINNSFNVGEIDTTKEIPEGDRKWNVARSLGKNMDAKQSHDAFLKGILVEYDIKLNGAMQPEFQRYTVGQSFIMQQSKMHSLKKLMDEKFDPFTKYVTEETRELVNRYYAQWEAVKAKGDKKAEYEARMKLLHNLPLGIELWATISSNYLQLKTQVIQRAKHPQQEDWGTFIEFCYSLPRFRELCGFEDSKWDLESLFPLVYKK